MYIRNIAILAWGSGGRKHDRGSDGKAGEGLRFRLRPSEPALANRRDEVHLGHGVLPDRCVKTGRGSWPNLPLV